MSESRVERERCEVCRWWRIFDETIPDCAVGWCHRYPPTIPPETMVDGQKTIIPDEASWFPLVEDWSFCGEFQKKDGIPRGLGIDLSASNEELAS